MGTQPKIILGNQGTLDHMRSHSKILSLKPEWLIQFISTPSTPYKDIMIPELKPGFIILNVHANTMHGTIELLVYHPDFPKRLFGFNPEYIDTCIIVLTRYDKKEEPILDNTKSYRPLSEWSHP